MRFWRFNILNLSLDFKGAGHFICAIYGGHVMIIAMEYYDHFGTILADQIITLIF